MKIQIRTKDNLVSLLKQGISFAWRINKERLDRITEVEIFDFSGKVKIVGTFDRENTKILENGRVAVAFKDAKIEQSDYKWIGQNPIKYVSANKELELMDDEVEKSNEATKCHTFTFDDDDNYPPFYEISLYKKELSRDELLNLTDDILNDYIEEFYNEKSAYLMADNDNCIEPFDEETLDIELLEILDEDGMKFTNLENFPYQSDEEISEYRLVIFNIYEDCVWESMEVNLPENLNISEIQFNVYWSNIEDIKYMEKIQIAARNDKSNIYGIIYPFTSSAHIGNKYNGKIFAILLDNRNISIVGPIEINTENFIKMVKNKL